MIKDFLVVMAVLSLWISSAFAGPGDFSPKEAKDFGFDRETKNIVGKNWNPLNKEKKDVFTRPTRMVSNFQDAASLGENYFTVTTRYTGEGSNKNRTDEVKAGREVYVYKMDQEGFPTQIGYCWQGGKKCTAVSVESCLDGKTATAENVAGIKKTLENHFSKLQISQANDMKSLFDHLESGYVSQLCKSMGWPQSNLQSKPQTKWNKVKPEKKDQKSKR